MELVRFCLERAARERVPLDVVDAFDCPGLFKPADREYVLEDIRRYERKLVDPGAKARTARVRVLGQFGGEVELDALLVRRVQDVGDPNARLFFKDWARTDTERAPGREGFEALCVAMADSAKGRTIRRTILSVTPASNATLRGPGGSIDEAESTRRRELHRGEDDRVRDPVTGEWLRHRVGYSNADPWYDGRAHGFTIIDAPRFGTQLTEDEVEAIFLENGRATAIRPSL